MDNFIIIIIESLFPVAIIAFLAFVIMAAWPKSNRPKFLPGQDVLGQNYISKAGDYVPCKITRAYTEWRADRGFVHLYECEPAGQKNTLTLSEDRIKSLKNKN